MTQVLAKIACLHALLFICLTANSQTIILGLKGGLSLPSLQSNSEILNFEPSTGFNFGLDLRAPLGDKMDLLTEFSTTLDRGTFTNTYNNIVSTGTSGTLQPTDININHRLTWAPILNYYVVAPSVSLQAGGFLRLTNMSVSDFGGQPTFNKDQTLENNLDTRNFLASTTGFDYGPLVGVGFGKEYWRINARYYTGMRNLAAETADSYANYSDLNLKSSMLQITFSYYMPNVVIVQ